MSGKLGLLRSGSSGKKVKSRKQAIAIGLSEARQRERSPQAQDEFLTPEEGRRWGDPSR